MPITKYDFNKQELIDLYNQLGTWNAVAIHLGVNKQCIERNRKKLGIKQSTRAGGNTKPIHKKIYGEKYRDIIINLYRKHGNWKSVAKDLGVSASFITKIKKIHNITLNDIYIYNNNYKPKYKNKKGYIEVSKYNPLNHRNKITPEHILKIERRIKRELLPGECIHHIDGDKCNNEIDNLLLCKSVSEHKKIEAQLQRLAYQLIRNDTIYFNRKHKKYVIPTLEKLPSSRMVFLFGDIDHELTLNVINSLITLDEREKGNIILCMCSDGGDYELCMSIYDVVKTCRNNVNGIVCGKAYSSASIILQACFKRFMTKNSLLLLHDGEIKIERETHNQYKSDCKFYDKTFSNMYNIYCNKSKLNKNNIKNICQSDTYFTAEEALKVGLIDKVLNQWSEAF